MRIRSVWAVFVWLVLAPAGLAAQQTGVVSGRVIDAASGSALASVQIRIEGTTLGTVTDAGGEYRIAGVAPGTLTLLARRVGYAAERRTVTLAAGATATQDFSLRVAAITLGEIVVTGVGAAAERRQLGNTIETVSREDVAEAPGITAIDQALQGKVVGATISENSGQPGGGVSIRLRGTNSILGGAEPLYVIDGVIVDNNAEALVSLSANAPRGGAALTNRLADLDPADVERIEVLKGAAAAALYGSRANNGVIQIFTRRGQMGATRVNFSSEYGSARAPARFQLNRSPYAGFGDVLFGRVPGLALGDPVERFDIQDQVFRTAQSTTNRLSVTGGGGTTTYFLAGSHQFEEGILRSTDYRRTSVRANLSHALHDKVDLSVRTNFISSLAHYTPEGEQTQGSITSIIFTPTSFNPNFDPDLGRYPYNPLLGANPLDVLDRLEAPEEVTRFIGGFELTARPLPSVSVRYLAGIDDYRREVRYFLPPGLLSAGYTGSVQNPVQFSRLFNNDLAATHVANPSPLLGLTTTLGFRYTQDEAENVRAASTDLPPGQGLVSGAVQSASQSRSELRTVGAFVEERVAIADRLFLTAGLNVEGSSAFGAAERWPLFPRLSASYIVDQEPWWRRSQAISSLRLRLAYGETGGQPPGLYSRLENYAVTAFGGRPGLVASTTAGNDELKPERQREVEGGFDIGLLDDRAQFELTVYDKLTRDLVLSVPLPPSSGFQRQFQNIGEVSNRGLELALNTVNVTGPRVTWRSRLTYATNRNRVERLAAVTDTLLFDYLNAVIVGQPVGVFFGGVYARGADGRIVHRDTTIGTAFYQQMPLRARDTLPDGSVAFARRILGDPSPDFIATFSNTVEIGRRMQISMLLDGRFGNDVANFTRRITELFGVDRVNEREIAAPGAEPDTFPRTFTLNPTGRSLIYEEYIEDGSFVKLRELSLQVGIDPRYVQRLGLNTAHLRLAGRNLYTWTRYRGLDPEINMFSANTVSRGVDFATTPIPRQFMISLTLGY